MIVVLKGADFSANNLGQVQVKTDISDFTKAAIAASGNDSLTLVQKSALDGFFNILGAGKSGNTIASRMRYVFLPILANDVSNALINYKDDMFVKSAIPSATSWKMEDGGIVGVDNSSAGAIVLPLTNPVVENNVCMLAMTSRSTNGTTGNQHFLSIRGKQDSSKWLTFYKVGSAFGSLPNQWFRIKPNSQPTGNVYGYNLQSSSLGCTVYGSVLNFKTTLPDTDLSDQTSEDIYTMGLSTKNIVPTAFMMLGESLTDEELRNMVSAIDALADAWGFYK